MCPCDRDKATKDAKAGEKFAQKAAKDDTSGGVMKLVTFSGNIQQVQQSIVAWQKSTGHVLLEKVTFEMAPCMGNPFGIRDTQYPAFNAL